jgi:hypothetical protein
MLTFFEVPVGRCYRAFYTEEAGELGYHPEQFPCDFQKITEENIIFLGPADGLERVTGSVETARDSQLMNVVCRKLIPSPRMSKDLKTYLLDKLPCRVKKNA